MHHPYARPSLSLPVLTCFLQISSFQIMQQKNGECYGQRRPAEDSIEAESRWQQEDGGL